MTGARWLVVYHPDHPKAVLRLKGPREQLVWRERTWRRFGNQQPRIVDVSGDVEAALSAGGHLAFRLSDERLVALPELPATMTEYLAVETHDPHIRGAREILAAGLRLPWGTA